VRNTNWKTAGSAILFLAECAARSKPVHDAAGELVWTGSGVLVPVVSVIGRR
jgi:hypothetical protein